MKINSIKSTVSREISTLTYDHGKSINGVIKRLGLETTSIVKLYEHATGRLVAITASDQNGNYQFTNLTIVKHMVVATDPTKQFNAVIQDNVVPK